MFHRQLIVRETRNWSDFRHLRDMSPVRYRLQQKRSSSERFGASHRRNWGPASCLLRYGQPACLAQCGEEVGHLVANLRPMLGALPRRVDVLYAEDLLGDVKCREDVLGMLAVRSEMTGVPKLAGNIDDEIVQISG